LFQLTSGLSQFLLPSQIGFSVYESHAFGLTSSQYTTTSCQALQGVALQMSPVKIDGAKRQLFSLTKSHNVRLQEAALKRRKSPSPDANPIDAQTAAAEEAAREADAEHSVKEEAEQQAAGTGKKTKAVKKENSMDEEAAQGSGKARLVKRKRKDDAEPKVMHCIKMSDLLSGFQAACVGIECCLSALASIPPGCWLVITVFCFLVCPLYQSQQTGAADDNKPNVMQSIETCYIVACCSLVCTHTCHVHAHIYITRSYPCTSTMLVHLY